MESTGEGTVPDEAQPPSASQPAAGWYPNPTGPGRRYWDGERWTDSYAEDARQGAVIPWTAWASLAGAIGVVIGSVGPWATAFIVSKNGLDGDGVITIICGLVACAALGWGLQQRDFGSAFVFGAISGLVAVGVAIYDIVDIYSTKSDFFGQHVQIVRPGWGLWLTAVGAGVLFIASLMGRSVVPTSEA